MADSRFFETRGPFRLGELAEMVGAELAGEAAAPDQEIVDVASLKDAGPQHLTFLDNKRYLSDFEASRAAVCIVASAYVDRAPSGMALLVAKAPYRAFARIARAFHPDKQPVGGVDSFAIVHPTAQLGEGCSVAAGAVLGANSKLGERCIVRANAVIGDNVSIGDDTEIGANASLSHCLIGARIKIHPGVRIGQRGFGFDMSDYPYEDVPQLGRVLVEEDVEIGANSTVDRGAGRDTVIGAGSKIDNLVQIGHNVQLGRGCVLVAQSGVAGSTILEDFAVVAGQAGIAGHLRIGRGAQVGAASGVIRDIPPGQKVLGTPAMPIRDFFRLVTIWQRLLKTKGKSDE